jgi:hypothetical protein
MPYAIRRALLGRGRYLRACAAFALALLSTNCNKGQSLAPPPETTARPVVAAAPETAVSQAPSIPPAVSPSSVAYLPPYRIDEKDFKPHRLEIKLNDETDTPDFLGNKSYVSEDGSTCAVIVQPDEGGKPARLLIRPIDDSSKAVDLPLLKYPCSNDVHITCRGPYAEKHIRAANKLLATHKWSRFLPFVADQPSGTANACLGEKLDRHFRSGAFDVDYKIVDAQTGMHLRIVRDDGAVITDSDFQVHTPEESVECRRGTMPYISDLGYDGESQAMYVHLQLCHTDGCARGDRFLVFRLPPLPKMVDTPPTARVVDGSPPTNPECTSRLSPAETRRLLADLGKRALIAIERRDARGFAALVHPKRGLDVGVLGNLSFHIDARDVPAAFRDTTVRIWDSRKWAADGDFEMSYRGFFERLRDNKYTASELVGYSEVVQEDGLCGYPCNALSISTAFPCRPFIQYARGTDAYPNMWRFVAVAFDLSDAGWRIVGLLEHEWQP